MEKLRPNNQRARNAVTLIWFVLIFDIIAIISSYLQYDLLRSIEDGIDVPTEAAQANDLREMVIGIVQTVIFLISGIVFIQWFRRAYFNLHQMVSNLSHSEGWAAGSWFVPIINLYRPYRIMKELYIKTRKLLISNGIETDEQLSTKLLGFWWALWIISGLFGYFVFNFSMVANTIEDMIFSTLAEMIISILGIPLALVTVKIIKDYSRVEPFLTEMEEMEDKLEPEVISELIKH